MAKNPRDVLRRVGLLLFALSVAYLFAGHETVWAIKTTNDKEAVITNRPLYDPGLSTNCTQTQSASSPGAAATTKSVYVLGDSLTVGMDTAGLQTKLGTTGWTVTKVEATVGDKVSDALPKIDADSASVQAAGAAIVGLGTNPGPDTPQANFAQQIDQVLAALHKYNSLITVYWINAYTLKSTYPGVNAALTEADQAGKISLIDWQKEALANASSYKFSGDGIHMADGANYGRRADFVVSAFNQGDGANAADDESVTSNDTCTASGTNTCTTAALPSISDTTKVAQAVDDFIKQNGGTGTPFDGLGSHIVAGAVRSGVNPFLVVAIARKESTFGTAGIATQGTYNAFGRTTNSGGKAIGSHTWYVYPSWEQSVDDPAGDDQSAFLKRVYIDGFKLTNIQDVIFKYAPPSENNSDLYAKQINDWISELITASGTGLSCGGSGSDATAPTNPSGNVALGKQLAAAYGWGDGAEWECLFQLWQHESGWNEKADNPGSSAYGIPQALPGSKMADHGADWQTNPSTQIKWGLDYIKARYTTACGAWTLWQRRSPHWY